MMTMKPKPIAVPTPGAAAAPPVTFAQCLQSLLDDAGITAYRLSQLSGLRKQAISRYLHGREPTFMAARRIAAALGVSLAVFDGVTVTLPGEDANVPHEKQ